MKKGGLSTQKKGGESTLKKSSQENKRLRARNQSIDDENLKNPMIVNVAGKSMSAIQSQHDSIKEEPKAKKDFSKKKLHVLSQSVLHSNKDGAKHQKRMSGSQESQKQFRQTQRYQLHHSMINDDDLVIELSQPSHEQVNESINIQLSHRQSINNVSRIIKHKPSRSDLSSIEKFEENGQLQVHMLKQQREPESVTKFTYH